MEETPITLSRLRQLYVDLGGVQIGDEDRSPFRDPSSSKDFVEWINQPLGKGTSPSVHKSLNKLGKHSGWNSMKGERWTDPVVRAATALWMLRQMDNFYDDVNQRIGWEVMNILLRRNGLPSLGYHIDQPKWKKAYTQSVYGFVSQPRQCLQLIRSLLPGGKDRFESDLAVDLAELERVSSWKEIFGNDWPVYVEIGPGKGTTLTERADRGLSEHVNYLAIERQSLDQRRERWGNDVPIFFPSNVRFLQADARVVFSSLPSNLKFAQAHFDFPDGYASGDLTPFFWLPKDVEQVVKTISPNGRLIVFTESDYRENTIYSAAKNLGYIWTYQLSQLDEIRPSIGPIPTESIARFSPEQYRFFSPPTIRVVVYTKPPLTRKSPKSSLEETAVFVVDPLRIFYWTEQAGALAVSLVQGTLIDPERLPGLRSEDVQVSQLTNSQEPAPYTIVVKIDGEILPQEEVWKQNHVAVITLTQQTTLAQLIQEALAQWTGRSVGDVLQIEHENGQLRIYT